MKVITRGITITEIFSPADIGDDRIEIDSLGEEIKLMLTNDVGDQHSITLNRVNFDELLRAMAEAGVHASELFHATHDEQGATL